MGIIIHNTRLPVDIERGTEFGAEFSTSLSESDGGQESANINWTYPRMGGDISYGIQSMVLMRAVQSFFFARHGRAYGFLFKDWFDFQLTAQNIGTGDASDLTWQIVKTYSDTVLPFTRKITRPISPISVTVNGVLKTVVTHYNINYDTGLITFTGGNAPGAGHSIVVAGEFNVPVRFDIDKLPFRVEHAAGTGAISTGSIPIIEVRE